MESKSRKNKRGARGSMEKKPTLRNVPTWRIVARSQSWTRLHSKPSLIDIKEMLVDIKIIATTILKEYQQLKQEIKELKGALDANQRETEKLKTQLTKAEKANDNLQNELEQARHKLYGQIEETNRLDKKYDELEQYSRSSLCPVQAYERHIRVFPAPPSSPPFLHFRRTALRPSRTRYSPHITEIPGSCKLQGLCLLWSQFSSRRRSLRLPLWCAH